MANLIIDEFKDYLANLTATNEVCSVLGTTFTSNTNLFVAGEPINIGTCLSINSYSSGPPTPEGDRHDSNVQIRLKCQNKQTAMKTMQSIINTFHNNTKICSKGRVSALQSNPITFEFQEGGEYIVTISNYNIRHVKL